MPQTTTERTTVVDGAEETEVQKVGLPPVQGSSVDRLIEEELVEDISIDGMCGVY